MCFGDPVQENKLLGLHGKGFDKTEYLNYLMGFNHDPKYDQVDYENVSLQLEDYIWAYIFKDDIGNKFYFSDVIRKNGKERFR